MGPLGGWVFAVDVIVAWVFSVLDYFRPWGPTLMGSDTSFFASYSPPTPVVTSTTKTHRTSIAQIALSKELGQRKMIWLNMCRTNKNSLRSGVHLADGFAW